MGDRGNCFVVDPFDKTDDGTLRGVYLYTHWGGSELPVQVAAALDSAAGRNRWNDSPYLTRIIFDAMTGGDRGETGFGISTTLADNEHAIVVVHPGRQEVRLAAEGTEHDADGAWISFEEFIAGDDIR